MKGGENCRERKIASVTVWMEKSVQLELNVTAHREPDLLAIRWSDSLCMSFPCKSNELSTFAKCPYFTDNPSVPARDRVGPTGIKINFNHNGERYSGVQKRPALPNFFNDKISSDAYSFTRER